jgi:hypothetical protein
LKVNHSGNSSAVEAELASVRNGSQRQSAGFHRVGVVLGFILYGTILILQPQAAQNPLAMLGIALVIYVLSIYLYYGVELTTFFGNYLLVAVSAIGALVLAAVMLVSAQPRLLLSVVPIGSIALSGVAGGLLTARYRPKLQVFLIGAAIVMLGSALQYAPLWGELMQNAGDFSKLLIEDARADLAGMGLSIMEQSSQLEMMQQGLALLIRLIPAFSILSVVMMFAIAHLLFLRRVWRVDVRHGARSFVKWKMPFAVTPIVVVAIAVRMFGNDFVQQVADNILFMLGFGYCLTGLSLLEYGMQKIGAGIFMRVSLYLLLFVTQVIGLFVIALIGFIDSFADWRKVDSDPAAPAAAHELK